MTRKHIIARGAVAIVLLTAGACPDRGVPNRKDAESVRYQRKIQSGQLLLRSVLACSDGKHRNIGGANDTQIITFATSNDCLTCGTHAAGLDLIRRTDQLHIGFFTVAYAAPAQEAMVIRSLAAETSNPVCFDAVGRYWLSHDLSHTPLTVVVQNGRIIYLHDTALDTDSARTKFVRAVRYRL